MAPGECVSTYERLMQGQGQCRGLCRKFKKYYLILSGLLFLRLLTCSEDIGNFRLRPIVQKIWRLLHTKGCMSSRTAAVWNQDKAYKVQFVREEHSLVRYDN